MLKRYRSIVVALGLILAAYHPYAEAQPKQPNSQERSARALESIASRFDEQAKQSDLARDTEQCQQGDDKRYSDLCAQWKAADAAADSAWWAVVGGFASAISTLLVLIALYLAFRSNWIARDTARRELRAYISHAGYEMKFHRDAKGTVTAADVSAKWINAGQTPAQALCYISWELRDDVLPSDFTFPRPANFDDFRPLALGPHQECNTVTQPITMAEFEGVSNSSKRLFVWGAADYLDAFGSKRRTETACQVMAVPMTQGEYRIVFKAIDRHTGMDEGCFHPPEKSQGTANDDSRHRTNG